MKRLGIELKTDLNGKEYLEYSVERQTKTKSGDNPAKRRAVKPRMFENKAVGPERDPVFVYKLYRSKTVLYIAALTREISCSILEINVVLPRTHVLFSIYLTPKKHNV